jgi:hypothetical protein
MKSLRATRLVVMLGLAAAMPCVLEAGPFGTVEDAARAEARAVAFLTKEVPAWSRDNSCFSCHNNGDAARALYVAASKAHRIPAFALADTTAWLSQPARWSENKGDPAFSDKRLANIQFAASLLTALETGHLKDPAPLETAAQLLVADQRSDGAWPIDADNTLGSPVTYGTELGTWMALRTLRRVNSNVAKEAARRAERWLTGVKAQSTLAAAAVLLATATDSSEQPRAPARSEPARAQVTSEPTRAPARSEPTRAVARSDSARSPSRGEEARLLSLIRSAQTRDGGWGPYADSPAEPFDTAVVLLALQQRREERGIADAIRNGRRFLVARQNPDGSWPATTRPPGGNSYAQLVSTTAWSLLALLETRD